MDNPDCLKPLIEDIVEKQNNSLISIEKLIHNTETVSSDISNLINRLQMVGNRQFAESRVHDEDLSNNGQKENFNLTPVTTILSPASTSGNCLDTTERPNLKLSTILLKAIELVPSNQTKHVQDESTPPLTPVPEPDETIHQNLESKQEIRIHQTSKNSNQTFATTEASASVKTVCLQASLISPTPPPPPPPPPPPRFVEIQTEPVIRSEVEEKPPPRPAQQVSQTKARPSVNRDRVADILKRYSLYDDDDYEEENDDDIQD